MGKQPTSHIIFNPTAGQGKAGRLLPDLLALLDNYFNYDYQLHLSRGPLDATRLARQAALSGAELVVAAGGDGTIQEVVNGLYENRKPVCPGLQLGLINFGTGQGFAQSLQTPATLAEQVEVLKKGTVADIDVGCVRYHDDQGEERERLFINECQAGIGADVVARVGKTYKTFGGKIAFGLATVRQAMRGRPYPIQVRIDDDDEAVWYELIGLAADNGSFMGGGMRLTPEANPGDGWLDILFMHRMTVPQRLLNFTRIYSGRHLESRFFSLRRGRSIELTSRRPVRIEADGELLGRLPANIELLADRLQVKVHQSVGTHGRQTETATARTFKAMK